MQNSLAKAVIISLIIAAPSALLVVVLNYAAFQHISPADSFNLVTSQPAFGQAYLFAFIVVTSALVILSTFVRGSSSAPASKTSASSATSSAEVLDGDREIGTVKWFNVNKGFGFISRTNGEDVFVHYRSIRGEGHRKLQEGQEVEFVVSEGEKGLQADDVIPAAK